ncbi:hypothetical protein RHOSPDRAFT_27106 [Rhodotorula sp. JG-1b]|nr:hypothetical protein RHOSPDRAFT_27106 [Rhodotorula sp. JG-1b]
MSSSEKQLECFVCGQATRNRCSSCAKAGVDIAFCSSDHQKLVWFAHKLVCGPGKAQRFRHPKLNDAELEIAQRASFRDSLNQLDEHTFRSNDLGWTCCNSLELLVGAPKDTLVSPILELVHRLNSWISSLSPDPSMQSVFYRTLRSLIGLFIANTVSIAAAYKISPLWEAAGLEVATGNAIPDRGLIMNVPGLPDRLAPVLHLTVVWNAVLQLKLASPNASAPVLSDATIAAQLERLLQGFVDISPSPTPDVLLSSVSAVTARLAALPLLDPYSITCPNRPQQTTSVEVRVTRCA